MSIPVLIILGLCFFSYKAGEFIGRKRPELEEEIKRLNGVIGGKDRELKAGSTLAKSAAEDYQKLLAQQQKESDERLEAERADALTIDGLKNRVSQLEVELKSRSELKNETKLKSGPEPKSRPKNKRPKKK
ncbi:MAG: hypothetical protein Q8R14_00410 [Candidatus Omnitrophota bacterium]|nr:hypothetical protein [Candidatus Omnitrophota bacterium]